MSDETWGGRLGHEESTDTDDESSWDGGSDSGSELDGRDVNETRTKKSQRHPDEYKLDHAAFCMSIALHGGMKRWRAVRASMAGLAALLGKRLGGGGGASWAHYKVLLGKLDAYTTRQLQHTCDCEGHGTALVGAVQFRELDVKLDTRFSARRAALSATSTFLCGHCNKALAHASRSHTDPDWEGGATGLLELKCTSEATVELIKRRVLPRRIIHDACTAAYQEVIRVIKDNLTDYEPEEVLDENHAGKNLEKGFVNLGTLYRTGPRKKISTGVMEKLGAGRLTRQYIKLRRDENIQTPTQLRRAWDDWMWHRAGNHVKV